MPNIIINGGFERGLEMWDVVPEHYEQGDQPLVAAAERTGEVPNIARGSSLRIARARHLAIRQTLPVGALATERHLRFSYGGYTADFYVNIHYADGTQREGGHYYGYWPEAWEDAMVRVSTTKPVARVEFLFMVAMDFYLDDISLEGTLVPAESRPMMKKAPEEVDESRDLGIGLEECFLATQRELNRISALLAMQQYPNLRKEVEEALAKHPPEEAPRAKKR